MMTVTAGLGFPISYLDQRDGSVFHDVHPTRGNEAEVSSQSSSVDLGLHTEMFFHPEPPDHLVLHCLRSPRGRSARTCVASVADIEEKLSEEDRALLREPLFALDIARLHGSYTIDGRPCADTDPRPRVPIIADSPAATRFRFEPALMTPTTVAAAAAMRRAEQAAESVATPGVLVENSILIIDNRRAAHSRSPFTAESTRLSSPGSHRSWPIPAWLESPGFPRARPPTSISSPCSGKPCATTGMTRARIRTTRPSGASGTNRRPRPGARCTAWPDRWPRTRPSRCDGPGRRSSAC
ncbi:TauD/TfdA family dioxygenase [Actinokineospora sp. 24-640]